MGQKSLNYILILTLIFFGFLNFIYFDFSYKLDNYYETSTKQLRLVEDIIIEIHKEDSKLYKALLDKKYTNLTYSPSFNLTTNITQNQLFSQNKILTIFQILNSKLKSDTCDFNPGINNYFALQKLRDKIIYIHNLQLSSQSLSKDLDIELNTLLKEYESLVNETISDFNLNLLEINSEIFNFKESLKRQLIIKFSLLLLFYLISLLIILKLNFHIINKNSQTKNLDFLDNDLKKIINFIETSSKQNKSVTIRDVKKELNLTHPTILSKLKYLKQKDIIEIKKQGRNKFIFLK